MSAIERFDYNNDSTYKYKEPVKTFLKSIKIHFEGLTRIHLITVKTQTWHKLCLKLCFIKLPKGIKYKIV